MKRPISPILLLLLLCAVWYLYACSGQAAQSSSEDETMRGSDAVPSHPADTIATAQWTRFCDTAIAKAEAWYDRDSLLRAVAVLDSAIRVLHEAGRAESLETADLWAWEGFAYREMGRYSDVLDAYRAAIRIYERRHFNHPRVAYCYKNAAQVYIRRQNYDLANQFLKAGILSDSTGDQLLSIYGQLANNAYWQDSFDLALRYFNLGKNVPGQRYHRASLQSIGALVMIEKGRWRRAEELNRQALQYYRSDPDETENRIRCYTALAEIAAKTQRPALAVSYYREAEKESLNGLKGKHREKAKLYTDWGDFERARGRNGEALQFYQKALIQSFSDFNEADPAQNPAIENPPVELWAMAASARKAALLLETPDTGKRRSAARCFDLALAVAGQLRRTYGTDEAKLYLAQHNYNLRREAAVNLWALYRETRETTSLERLFDLLENNRANTLRDALQQQRALALAAIPDSLLQREENLRRDIAVLQAELLEQGRSANAGDPAGGSPLQTALFQAERQYEDLIAGLDKNHPRFGEFNRADQTARLQDIRKALPDSTGLFSWFDAGDRYLCLVLRTNDLHAYEVPRDSALDASLLHFQSLLADKNAQENDPADFFANAYYLKQRLLPDSALAGLNSLAIVPDGRLSYLPFDALLSAPHRGAYATAPYLLRRFHLRYAWSATLLAAAPLSAGRGHGFLQVAPFVETARDGLVPLPNSLREKPESTHAALLHGADATAARFLDTATRFEVLHLSTHAHAGRRSQPSIEFFDRSVALPEIYAQRLHASLVLLSACETGAGEFAEGEGVLSLARAFAYAGAQSLIASHWSVNDRSTAELFAAFYRQLEQGAGKSEALRQAKLHMLAQPGPDARKAPFYWAAFAFSGSDGQVGQTGGSMPWWVWLWVAGFLLAGAWVALRRDR
ncbi:MAG: CHAT domain-containing tetratricopeptide repeat protein [Saprospiraceae bacterium]